jgi:hypothetical protein
MISSIVTIPPPLLYIISGFPGIKKHFPSYHSISFALSANGSAIAALIASRIPGIDTKNSVSSIERQSSSEIKTAALFSR